MIDNTLNVFVPPGRELGGLCKKKHNYLETGRSLRYANNRDCVECALARRKGYYSADPGRDNANSKRWYQENKEAVIPKRKAYRQTDQCRRVRSLNQRKRKHLQRSTCTEPYTAAQLRDRFSFLGSVCIYCGSRENIQIDHITALSRGGVDALWNIAPACERCNNSKRDQDVEIWYKQQSFYNEYSLDFLLGRVD